jgi:hypothetical protein
MGDTWLIEGKVFNALGVKMDLAMLVARETLEQFGERALRAVPAINEW